MHRRNTVLLLKNPKTMHLQINIKPKPRLTNFPAYQMNLYINGDCFSSIIHENEVFDMVKRGIVVQVKGQRTDENNTIIEFDYPDKVDGAGVQFTSNVYQLSPYKDV
jgi:hypothetical protein